MCNVEGCDRLVYGQGMCRGHYMRMRRLGDQSRGGATMAAHGEPRRWLEAHASHDGDDCLMWPFPRGDKGYGQVAMPGRTSTPAHRLMCRIAHGEPPAPEYHAAHSCGKGRDGCVNPKHLRWTTPIGNMADKEAHGTVAAGERNGSSKLTRAQVVEIRSLKGSVSQEKIGKMFGVAQSTISEIHLGKKWRGVC